MINRKIIIEKEENKKISIVDKMRAEIEEQYKNELEEKFIKEQEKYQAMMKKEKEDLENEYIAKKEQLEEQIRIQEEEAQREMNEKIIENEIKIKEEQKAFEEQKEKELEELRKKERKAEKKISEEREKCSKEIEKIKKETNDAIKRKNIEIQRLNEIIQKKNNNEAELQALKEKIKVMEEIINRKKEESIASSIFEISETGSWHEIGYIFLERKKDKKDFTFSDDRLSLYYAEDKRYPDGIIIEKGKKTSIIAVHEIFEKNGVNESLIRFYSDSKVVPIYNLLGVLNCILHIHQTGFNIKNKEQAREIKLRCLVYSEKKLENINNDIYIKDSTGTYLLTYKDNKYTNIGLLAQALYEKMHCSKKGISDEIIDRTESVALQKSMQIEGKGEYIESIKYLSENDDGEPR